MQKIVLSTQLICFPIHNGLWCGDNIRLSCNVIEIQWKQPIPSAPGNREKPRTPDGTWIHSYVFWFSLYPFEITLFWIMLIQYWNEWILCITANMSDYWLALTHLRILSKDPNRISRRISFNWNFHELRKLVPSLSISILNLWNIWILSARRNEEMVFLWFPDGFHPRTVSHRKAHSGMSIKMQKKKKNRKFTRFWSCRTVYTWLHTKLQIKCDLLVCSVLYVNEFDIPK